MTAGTLMHRARRTWRRDGVSGALASALQVTNARLRLRRASEVGAVRLRGRARVTNRGHLVIADGVRMEGTPVRIDLACFEGATLRIGGGTYINYGASIAAMKRVEIGTNCMFGQYAIVMDADYHDPRDHALPGKVSPVVIEDDVWLGARVTVLRGAHIGQGAVIGAHSVVTSAIPARSFAAGVPARVMRSLDQ